MSTYLNSVQNERDVWPEHRGQFEVYNKLPELFWSGYFSTNMQIKLDIVQFADYVNHYQNTISFFWLRGKPLLYEKV